MTKFFTLEDFQTWKTMKMARNAFWTPFIEKTGPRFDMNDTYIQAVKSWGQLPLFGLARVDPYLHRVQTPKLIYYVDYDIPYIV